MARMREARDERIAFPRVQVRALYQPPTKWPSIFQLPAPSSRPLGSCISNLILTKRVASIQVRVPGTGSGCRKKIGLGSGNADRALGYRRRAKTLCECDRNVSAICDLCCNWISFSIFVATSLSDPKPFSFFLWWL